jgi:hypothetical protein
VPAAFAVFPAICDGSPVPPPGLDIPPVAIANGFIPAFSASSISPCILSFAPVTLLTVLPIAFVKLFHHPIIFLEVVN